MAADINTIARPYAKAVFEYALENNALSEWRDSLMLLALVASDKQMLPFIGNPNVESAQLSDFVTSIGGDKLVAGAKNLVQLLATNKRLNALPAILEGYEHFKSEHEKSINVKVRSSVELTADQQSTITEKLEKKLGRKVAIETRIDPTILGGLIIEANDMVIDGSVRSKLSKLGHTLQS